MIARAGVSHRRVEPSVVEAFDQAALALRERTLRRLGVSLEVTGRAQPAEAAE